MTEIKKNECDGNSPNLCSNTTEVFYSIYKSERKLKDFFYI